MSPTAKSVLHYSVAGLVSLILYVKLGKEAAWIFFLSFVAYRMYQAIKFLSAGKSEVDMGEDGRLKKWDFKGSSFWFSADLTTMTARLVMPKGRTTTSNLYRSSASKTVDGRIDVVVPLRSLDFHIFDDTKVVNKNYGGIWNDYRQDGTWGPAIHSHATSSAEKTGNFRISFFCYPGSPKGEVVTGLENLNWSRDKSDETIYYSSCGVVSGRQTKDFLKRWNEMLELIK